MTFIDDGRYDAVTLQNAARTSSVSKSLRHTWNAVLTYSEQRRARRALWSLSDRELRDIGVTREDLAEALSSAWERRRD